MKKFFQQVIIFACALVFSSVAQPQELVKTYSWPERNLYAGASVLEIKTGNYIITGYNRLLVTTPEGDSLWSMRTNTTHENSVVDGNGDCIIVAENSLLSVWDYQGNFIKNIPVPTMRVNAVLNIWRVADDYYVACVEPVFNENQLFIYDKELVLKATHAFNGQLLKVAKKGEEIFTLQKEYSYAGAFNRVYRRDQNFQVRNLINFSEDKLIISFGEKIAVYCPHGPDGGLSQEIYGGKVWTLNYQLDTLSSYSIPGKQYFAEEAGESIIVYPKIRQLISSNGKIIAIGSYLDFGFTPHQGWYPGYGSGGFISVLDLDEKNQLFWSVRDSGFSFIAGTYQNGYLLMAGTWYKNTTDLFLKRITIGKIWDAAPQIEGFHLNQNYPNPFNPSTKISFVAERAGFFSLKIYDLQGNEVAEPLANNLGAGNHVIDFNGSTLPSGVYIYRLQHGRQQSAKKMVLIK